MEILFIWVVEYNITNSSFSLIHPLTIQNKSQIFLSALLTQS